MLFLTPGGALEHEVGKKEVAFAIARSAARFEPFRFCHNHSDHVNLVNPYEIPSLTARYTLNKAQAPLIVNRNLSIE